MDELTREKSGLLGKHDWEDDPDFARSVIDLGSVFGQPEVHDLADSSLYQQEKLTKVANNLDTFVLEIL